MINFENGKTPLSEETFNKLQSDLLKTVFPIGSTYITQEDTNPNTILGFGTWERLKGKVCLGLDEDDEDFNEIGKTGGEKKHQLTINEMPSHNHYSNDSSNYILGTEGGIIESGAGTGSSSWKWRNSVASQGGNQAHNNMQPYEITGYMWIRRS